MDREEADFVLNERMEFLEANDETIKKELKLLEKYMVRMCDKWSFNLQRFSAGGGGFDVSDCALHIFLKKGGRFDQLHEGIIHEIESIKEEARWECAGDTFASWPCENDELYIAALELTKEEE